MATENSRIYIQKCLKLMTYENTKTVNWWLAKRLASLPLRTDTCVPEMSRFPICQDFQYGSPQMEKGGDGEEGTSKCLGIGV